MNVTDRPEVSVKELQTIVENASNGLKIFNLLKTSIELGIFDHLKDKTTCEQLSKKLEIEPILTHYLLEVLVKIGLVGRDGEYYRNKPVSETYLNSESGYTRINCILSMAEPVELWNNLNQTLKGKITRKDTNFFPFIIKVLGEDCLSGELQNTMELVSVYDEFKNSKTLLDIGGGHGLYSIAFGQINPGLQCSVFDLPDVLIETQKYIDKYDSNVQTIPGNFYTDDFGGKYDMIFSSYNPGGKNPKIARKIYDSLNLNGLFINKQYFPENGSNSLGDLLDNMEWNFTKFEKSNKSNKRYTFKGDLSLKEYTSYLEDLGFKIMDVHPISHFNTSFGTISEDKIVIAKKVM